MKKEKGITLIALIITIIVMLILVAVTINVALNGGLFDRAKNASEQTQRESDREQLLSSVVATVDSNGKFHLDQIVPPEGFEKVSDGIYKNTNNEKEYIVDAVTGKVTEYNGTNNNLLAGKEFIVPAHFENEDSTTIQFTEDTVSLYGMNGRYTYDPNTKKVQLIFTIGDQEQALSENYLYEIKEDEETVNWLLLVNFDNQQRKLYT